MTESNSKRMYNDLKRLWLSTADVDTKDEAEAEFDRFISALLRQGAQMAPTASAEDEADEDNEVSQSRLLMEIILEIDTTMQMVPPRVKKYRDLLVQEGLDKTSASNELEEGQKGLAGINLADQAALEFHRALLGLSITIAQAEAYERVNKKGDEQ